MSQVNFISYSTSFGNDGERLYAELLIPRKNPPFPLAILCHGAASSHLSVKASAEQLVLSDMAAFIFDFRGHGLSSGICEGKMACDIKVALQHLSNYPDIDASRVSLVGHSMGAMAVLRAAAEINQLGALVLLSCPSGEFELPSNVNMEDKRHSFIADYPRMGTVPWVTSPWSFLYRPWMKLHRQHMKIDWRKFLAVYHSGSSLAALLKIRACPILFVHCRGDKYAPYQSALHLYEQACEPKRMILESGGHATPINSRKLRSKWISWLTSVAS